ncbi:hypothetical protein DFR54_11043 [Vagococcus fluvialis]|nr:hypothetical protein DFR54_11043 [Vagococcus fluvialis]
MMKRRTMGLITVGVLSLGILAGCGNSEKKRAAIQVRLKFGFNFQMKRLKVKHGKKLLRILIKKMKVSTKQQQNTFQEAGVAVDMKIK